MKLLVMFICRCIVATTFLLSFLSGKLQAQEVDATLFKSTSHYFGTFSKAKGKQTHRFELVNTSNKPLVINRVRSTCGCAATEYTREPIAPGGEGYVKVVFDPAKFSGYFSKRISVYTSAGSQPTQLTITGRIRVNNRINDSFDQFLGDLRAEKKENYLGDKEKKNEISADLKMINVMRDVVKLRLVSYPQWLSSCEITNSELKQGDNSRILIRVNTIELPQWGRLAGNIEVEIKRGIKTVVKKVPVAINLIDAFSDLSPQQMENLPVISYQPDTLHLNHKPGKVINSKVSITNSGKSPLHIRNVQSNSDQVHFKKYDAVIEPGKKGQVHIQFSCKAAINDQPQISIWSNDANRYRTDIQLLINN
ncbi:DUF1573 domain-containing protein [Carboxylicivirga sp. RSCT41]|uniref:DUF1573 domain-containing protein n=1 Tax=Carboxylicivirga agarovorans TaxID=3417570 RepID=UPI003D34AC12